jgi:hypothetical protein
MRRAIEAAFILALLPVLSHRIEASSVLATVLLPVADRALTPTVAHLRGGFPAQTIGNPDRPVPIRYWRDRDFGSTLAPKRT